MGDDSSPAWRTAISDARDDEIIYRGYDLVDLVENYDFMSIV
jgi:citrate synthase